LFHGSIKHKTQPRTFLDQSPHPKKKKKKEELKVSKISNPFALSPPIANRDV
jgi:hypothetical protein